MAAIYSNLEATELWDGQARSVLYVRLFRSYGVDQGTVYDNILGIYTETSEVPGDPYGISYYVDWVSQDYDGPFAPGVYALYNDAPQDVSNPVVLFYDD